MVDLDLTFGQQFASMNANFAYPLVRVVLLRSVPVVRRKVDYCMSRKVGRLVSW